MLRTIRNKLVFGVILLILLIQIVSALLQAHQIHNIFINEFTQMAKNYSQIIFLWLDEMLTFSPDREEPEQERILEDIELFVHIIQLGKFESILRLKEDLFSLSFVNVNKEIVVLSQKDESGISHMSISKKNVIQANPESLSMTNEKELNYLETDKYIHIFIPYFKNDMYCGGLILSYYNTKLTHAKVRTFLTSGILVFFYMSIASAIVFLIITRILTQPIREMTRLMSKLADGEFNHLYQIKSMDEIGEMGKSVNDLVFSLQSIFINIRTIIDNKNGIDTPSPMLKDSKANIRNLMEELKKAELNLRFLSRKLIDTLEEERKKIAVDLHDEVGQTLTALQFDIKLIEKSLSEVHIDQKDLCQKAMEKTKELAIIIRATCSRLRPQLLDDMGLAPTIESHVNELNDRNENLNIDFTTNASDKRFEPQVELTIYRVFQEAMNNVLKHAHAHNVAISLWSRQDEISLLIEDDGVGFHGADFDKDSPEASKASMEKGIGLFSMKERVSALNGMIIIDSAKYKGTRIKVKFQTKG